MSKFHRTKPINIPKPIKWVKSLVYDCFRDEAVTKHIAICPRCGAWQMYGQKYFPYCHGQNYCPYCRQKLIVWYPEEAKHEEPKEQVTGATLNENSRMVCDKCGRLDSDFKCVAHFDGIDFRTFKYECVCGNKIIAEMMLQDDGTYMF